MMFTTQDTKEGVFQTLTYNETTLCVCALGHADSQVEVPTAGPINVNIRVPIEGFSVVTKPGKVYSPPTASTIPDVVEGDAVGGVIPDNATPTVRAVVEAQEVIELSDDEDDLCRCNEGGTHLLTADVKGKSHVPAHVVTEISRGASQFASKFRNVRNSDIIIRSSGEPTYTPLQKWEFENGYSVDGVKDVEAWAIAVGLARDLADSLNPKKKTRTSFPGEQPNNSRFTIPETVDEDEEVKTELEAQNNVEDVLLGRSRKGKEKEDNRQER